MLHYQRAESRMIDRDNHQSESRSLHTWKIQPISAQSDVAMSGANHTWLPASTVYHWCNPLARYRFTIVNATKKVENKGSVEVYYNWWHGAFTKQYLSRICDTVSCCFSLLFFHACAVFPCVLLSKMSIDISSPLDCSLIHRNIVPQNETPDA